MAQLTTREYDALERAVRDGHRLSLVRRGRELVALPLRLFLRAGREVLDVRHPTTGDTMSLHIDELDAIEFLP